MVTESTPPARPRRVQPLLSFFISARVLQSKKSPIRGRFFIIAYYRNLCCRRFLQCFFQRFTSLEAGDDRWRNFYALRYVLRVDAQAPLSFFCKEGAESRERKLITALECIGDKNKKRFDHVFGLFFGDLELAGKVLNEV